MTPTNFDARLRVKLDENEDNTTQYVGMVIMAQKDGKGALTIEVNGNKEFRVRKIINNDSINS